MGSSPSAMSETPGGDLRLPASGLRFSAHHLRSVHAYIETLYEEDQKNRMSVSTEMMVEALVQKLVDGAGQRDPRFRCSHLIALHRGKKMRSRSLEYLVTIDSLPPLNTDDDCRLQESPVGYGKVRLSGREADKWGEFLTSAGYLCRDKVVERWVQLIARCAQSRGGGASRVLCARAHQHALPYSYCYLETSHQSSTERRLAIVEGPAWVMLRVGAGEAEAKLMLGARVGGCSPHAYTSTVPITHPLALLHYTATKGGYYAVTVGPPSSMVCAERSSTWQLWHPALEATLDSHCAEYSHVGKLAGALNVLVDKMREGCYEGSLQLLSRYAVSCALRRRLYRCSTYKSTTARACLTSHVSYHLLLILDDLLQLCSGGGVTGFVYPVEKGCLVRRAARDINWTADITALTRCLQYLHRITGDEEIPKSPSETLETAIFSKWERLSQEVRCTGPGSYTKRQLRYLNRVTSELVRCKRSIAYESHSTFRANLIQVTAMNLESIEDLIHIMAIILDQARDVYLNNVNRRTVGEFERELTAYRSKRWNKLKDYYDASSACLIDAVRRDKDVREEDLTEDTSLMNTVLHWLYKGAKEDKKYLGPVLKPFLDDLFVSSLENSWFSEDFVSKNSDLEIDGLREYCMGVHEGVIEPRNGLIEVAKKQAWAKAIVDFVDRHRLIDFRLIFPTGDGLAVSYPLKLPSRRDQARTLTLNRRDKAEAKLKLAKRCVVHAFNDVLVGKRFKNKQNHHGSTDEILTCAKNGSFWRTTKPDIIPSASSTLEVPKVRRRRPATMYGFPEISITNQSDTKTMRRKYHTLKSLVYSDQVDVKEMRRRPRSAGSSMKNKEPLSRPSLLETLDFINSVKDALCVEESGVSDVEDSGWSVEDEWVLTQVTPLNMITTSETGTLHLLLSDIILCALRRGCFTMLQELCLFLGESSEGALFSLHRLSRAARARSSERVNSTWKFPEAHLPIITQQYKVRSPDYCSGDETQPPPIPKRSTSNEIIKHYDCSPQIEIKPSTGIINPIYDIKIPKDKFVKRTKSLSRTPSTKSDNLTLRKNKTNDVQNAIEGIDMKKHFLQRYNGNGTIGSYRISRNNFE
ncbi:uncharacterized protein LOC110997172 isoform X1 [Pieris rapae]|uniref:uncharacterized protein LOC110997172 isoform X1 n=1 Tax=Pieris rapae TaxID=64459 RepID=UPI001E27B5FF|nr:uncharacterized protein LOC110997172 isoform X1 [Pieris rapae]